MHGLQRSQGKLGGTPAGEQPHGSTAREIKAFQSSEKGEIELSSVVHE